MTPKIHTVDLRRVLTVQQPWADWIVDGLKDVENRSWATNYRGRLWIHAGKTEDKGAWFWASAALGERRAMELANAHHPILGAIIGHVDLVDCSHASRSVWWTGSWAWMLDRAKRTEPEYIRGRQGLWIAGNQPRTTAPA